MKKAPEEIFFNDSKKIDMANAVARGSNTHNYIQNCIMYDIMSQYTKDTDPKEAPLLFIVDVKKFVKSMNKYQKRGGTKFEAIEKAVNNLMDSYITTEKSFGSKAYRINLFSHAYFDRESQIIEIGITPRAVQLFCNLSTCFTSIKVKDLKKLRLPRSQKLYEFIFSFYKFKKVTLTIKELKELLNVADTKKNKNWYVVKSRVLVPCLAEINESFSKLNLKFEEIKGEGKKVEKVKLYWDV